MPGCRTISPNNFSKVDNVGMPQEIEHSSNMVMLCEHLVFVIYPRTATESNIKYALTLFL